MSAYTAIGEDLMPFGVGNRFGFSAHWSALRQFATCTALTLSLFAGDVSTASADVITVLSDGSWLAKNVAPGIGWNTDVAFDTAADGGWVGASVNSVDCNGVQDCIWYDGQYSSTEKAWLRKTFTVSGPIASGTLIGGVDDDATIWINGTKVYDEFNGLAMGFGPIDITPYLVAGSNLIAVFADDNLFYGDNHTFHAQLTAVTRGVPEPSVLLLVGSGVATIIARRNRRRATQA
jgi:hypothetical protein